MLDKITSASVGYNVGVYSEWDNPWIWFSLFLFVMWGITIYCLSQRKKENKKLRELKLNVLNTLKPKKMQPYPLKTQKFTIT